MYRKEFPAPWQVALTGFAGVATAVGLILSLELWRRQQDFLSTPTDILLENESPSEQRLLPF